MIDDSSVTNKYGKLCKDMQKPKECEKCGHLMRYIQYPEAKMAVYCRITNTVPKPKKCFFPKSSKVSFLDNHSNRYLGKAENRIYFADEIVILNSRAYTVVCTGVNGYKERQIWINTGTFNYGERRKND